MEQLIRHVTTSITDQLPGEKSFFTPDDLREYDIPEFLVQRVEVEIYRNLNESIVPPDSEWADMSAANVENAWEQFIDAIVAEVRMPASFVPSVFETAIADVVEMILQPRQAIPAILFGPKKNLSAEELEKRLSFISVNSHLGQAILKYMIRKGKSEIELGTAKNVVMRVDERITANYNSLNWAQLLQPLFILAGPRIDTEMFRVFFKDRNMDRISRRFDLLNGSLNKTEFIEILSSPDLLNEEGYEDDQVSLFDVEPETNRESEPDSETKNVEPEKEDFSSSTSTLSKDAESQNIKEEVFENRSELKDSEDKVENEHIEQTEIAEDQDDEDSLLGSFQNSLRKSEKIEDVKEVEDDEDSETDTQWFTNRESEEENIDDTPLYSRFDGGTDEITEQEDEEPDRLADQFLDNEDEEPGDESEENLSVLFNEDEKVEREEDNYTFSIEEENTTSDDSEFEPDESRYPSGAGSPNGDIENPIWQSFLGDEDHIEEEDIPEYSGFADLDETEDEEFDEEEPLIDLTVQEEESAEELIGWLKNDEHRFVDHIFSGSDAAYEEALLDLKKFDDWKKASRFIEKEIFARNLVDMYDEEAVDFTDRLQAYFDEFKS